MSNWLSLNTSLNNLKGQLSNLANNVLNDSEEGTVSNETYEELKKTGIEKDLEIQQLKKLNAELLSKITGSHNGENNWDWTPQEEAVPKEDVSELNRTIRELENEKNDLISQLEQLDAENQQNLTQLVGIREKLAEENEELKEKYDQLKQQHKTSLVREKKLQKQLQELQANVKSKEQHVPSTNDSDTAESNMSAHNTDQFKIQSENKLQEVQQQLNKILDENKVISRELQIAQEQLKLSDVKCQEDEENCQKLAFILESFEKQVTSLKADLETMKNENDNLEKSREEIKNELNKAYEELEQTKKNLEQTNRTISQQSSPTKEIENLKTAFEKLTSEYKSLQSKKDDMHRSYINIITDNVKRYIDSESVHSEASDDPQALEFNKHVENIFKILLDFKEKCQSLECQVLEASQEKTQILNEKNTEIEKLMQNSEILSQEVINKTKIINELETEISNLMTSNDLLMSEMDSYKNSSGLQTISETNEDNMVLLETALDNANEKIKELEKIVEHEKSDSEHSLTSITKNEDYSQLLNDFDGLKIDYDSVSKELTNAKDHLKKILSDNENIKAQLDKAKSDLENIDYQLSEANFTIDNMREELDTVDAKLDLLSNENAQLKVQVKTGIDLKTELNDIKEKYLCEENRRRNLEAQVKNLTEKLQNSKMAETSFKLQCDTLNKENISLLETKTSLESSLSNMKASVAEYEKNYTELLQKYDEILFKCEELNTELHQKESGRLTLLNQLAELEEQKTELDTVLQSKNLSRDQEINDLLNKSQDYKKQIEALTKEKEENQKMNENELLNKSEDYKKQIEKLMEEKEFCQNEKHNYKEEIRKLQEELHNLREDHNKTSLQVNLQQSELLQKEVSELQALLQQSQAALLPLQVQLQEVTTSRNELINMITVKHQENITYHHEIQRLSEIIKVETDKALKLEAQLLQASSAIESIAKKKEEIDKLTDEINFLKEKCEILNKNLLEEQAAKSGPSDKEVFLSKQLDRLQSHMMEVEEHYTQELLQAEQKNADLQTKLTDLEQRERNSSNMYTSVSIRANQQVEALQNQLQMVTAQREELRKKISDTEDSNSKQAVALGNLQFVLEQFQKERDKDIIKETDRIRRQINVEKHLQEELKKEIDNLKEQLEESKQGLQAASRLSDQLELLKKQNSGLKDEVSQLQRKLIKSDQTIHNLTSQTDGKIDKSLIKSLVVGFLSSGNTNWNKDQAQVLKIIATVLDFNQQDHDKVKLNKTQHGSWLGSILFPQHGAQPMSQESLSQAFVKFLENESKPRIVPNLLDGEAGRSGTNGDSSSSKSSTPSATPIVLNEIVLPTFADFGQIRNSSSILKDVLKDNNNL